MNKFLKISIALNIAFAGLVWWLMHARLAAEISSPTAIASPTTTDISPPAAAQSLSAPKFRWSELESTDYHIYIANLRRIECPEQTIRDLINADVDEALYASRRDQLKQYAATTDLENSLQELNRQETNFIAALLGDSPTPVPAAPEPLRVPRLRVASQVERDLARPISTPLILQSIDPTVMKLSAAQTETIEELRQNFAEKLGPNQDPNDPAYRQRWQAAQREADDMLAGILGKNFVLNLQSETNLGN